MSTGGRRTARLALATLLVTGLGVLATAPAQAATTQQDSGTMSGGQALVVFGLVPLTVVGLIWLAVAAPGWTRAGRADAVDAWTGDPLVLDSGRPAEAEATEAEQLEAATEQAPEREAIEGVVEGHVVGSEGTGGTSARW